MNTMKKCIAFLLAFTSLELTWQIDAATMRPTNLSLAGDTDYGKMTATATYTY